MRLKRDSSQTFFHPFELAFSGESSNEKTAFILKLIAQLSHQFDIGFLKQVDYKELTQVDISTTMNDMDILFIETDPLSKLPKLLFLLNQEGQDKTIEDIKEGRITEIEAIISDSLADPFCGKYPFFHKEDYKGVALFILEYFRKKVPKDLKGIILTGGQSKRMQEDKGSISYHQNLSQAQYAKKLLEKRCSKVYISHRKDQKVDKSFSIDELIVDSFPSIGPASGILSAQFNDQKAAWLVLACDLPYLDISTIDQLIENRNPFKMATCFYSSTNKWPEPLCTIYEPKSYKKLMSYFSANKFCPRKVLFNSNIKGLNLVNKRALNNVNTPIEKSEALKYIRSSQGEDCAN